MGAQTWLSLTCPAIRCWGVGLGKSLWIGEFNTGSDMGEKELTHFCIFPGPCSDRQCHAVQAPESWGCSKAASLAEVMVLFSLLI